MFSSFHGGGAAARKETLTPRPHARMLPSFASSRPLIRRAAGEVSRKAPKYAHKLEVTSHMRMSSTKPRLSVFLPRPLATHVLQGNLLDDTVRTLDVVCNWESMVSYGLHSVVAAFLFVPVLLADAWCTALSVLVLATTGGMPLWQGALDRLPSLFTRASHGFLCPLPSGLSLRNARLCDAGPSRLVSPHPRAFERILLRGECLVISGTWSSSTVFLSMPSSPFPSAFPPRRLPRGAKWVSTLASLPGLAALFLVECAVFAEPLAAFARFRGVARLQEKEEGGRELGKSRPRKLKKICDRGRRLRLALYA